MLVAARTAPQNSYRNPVERIMSLINLGLQSVGLKMSEENEQRIELQFNGRDQKMCNV